ncbi:PD-(D/E)XK motif protein [Arthrobacter sp. ZBG10]|uniref:PD-(D/E)XK motif protein n=1 Tax=Arthrobacter sp. ZBG10 TaxID=1676590 RepID=UPI000682E25C|nr:PD-(D/E)XK motif protein [Arthrobacter sp. ZBG10]
MGDSVTMGPVQPGLAWSAKDWDTRRSSTHIGAWEVDPGLPLRLFYGVETTGWLTFGYVATAKPGSPPLSSAVRVHRRQRDLDEKWTLSLTLTVPDSETVFRQLAEHIYARVKATSSEERGVLAFMESVSEWKKLFAAPNRMSLAELRGLFAELYVGFVTCSAIASDAATVSAWEGPFMADQDFQFPRFSVEVKSIRPTSRAVDIASEYQLDGEDIYLAIATVLDDQTSFDGSMTLPELVASIRLRLQGQPSIAESFEDALAQHEIDLSDAFYEDTHLSCTTVRLFEVSGDFPRITAKIVPHGAAGVNYKILLSEIGGYERSIRDLVLTPATEVEE